MAKKTHKVTKKGDGMIMGAEGYLKEGDTLPDDLSDDTISSLEDKGFI